MQKLHLTHLQNMPTTCKCVYLLQEGSFIVIFVLFCI